MRALIALCLSLMLTGCMSGMMAGEYTETVATNPVTGEALTNRFGMVIKERKRISRSVAIMDRAAVAVQNLPDTQAANNCGAVSDEVLKEMGATAAAEYFRSRGQCMQTKMMADIVLAATGQPNSAAGSVMRESTKAVKYAEDGMTSRIRAVANPLAITIGVAQREKTARSNVEATANLGVAAAEDGDTIVNGLNVNTGQTAGADSNDGGQSFSNDGGSAAGGAGEGFAGAPGGEGSGIGGTGSGTATNTKTGDTVNLAIGSRNNIGFASGDANAQAGAEFSQQLEPSANGSLTTDSKLQGSDTADQLEGDETINDNDGSL